MPISGSWLQQVRYPEPQYSRVHTSDPAHMEWGAVEQTDPHPDQAPPYQSVGAAAPPWHGVVTNAPGLVLDRTPWVGGHDTPREQDIGVIPSPSHREDLGATEVIGRDAPITQRADESYSTVSSRGFDANASRVPEIVLRRGKDGQPENSPPSPSYDGHGFRLAYYYRWSCERNFKPPVRVHDYRWVSPQLANVSQNALVPDPAGPYNTPFDSLSRAINTWHDKPMLRRIPEPVDESMTTDGLDQGYEPALVGF